MTTQKLLIVWRKKRKPSQMVMNGTKNVQPSVAGEKNPKVRQASVYVSCQRASNSFSHPQLWRSHHERTVMKLTTGWRRTGVKKQMKYNATFLNDWRWVEREKPKVGYDTGMRSCSAYLYYNPRWIYQGWGNMIHTGGVNCRKDGVVSDNWRQEEGRETHTTSPLKKRLFDNLQPDLTRKKWRWRGE